MEEHRHVTIYDIAEKLNLAASTISRALKDHHSISEKTIKKVKQTAKEMGFVPNTLAAGLRGNVTRQDNCTARFSVELTLPQKK